MTVYSHSRLSSFEQCPLKFKYRYLDKIKPDVEDSIESHLGKAVHATLEWLYMEVKKNILPSIEDIIKYYSEEWEKTFNPETRIVRKNMSAKDYFNKGVQFLVDYYMKHKPFNDGTLEVEKRIAIDLDQEGKYKIRGFIDRLVYNLKEKRYEIHDYKTANMLPTQEKMDQDRQLALYSIAIKDIHGYDKEVVLIWHYLAHNTKIISKRTNEQLAALKRQTIALIDTVENATEFPHYISALCGWCEYKTMCPAFGGKQLERQKKIKDFAEEEEERNKEGQLDIWN
jgi:putative RecB family exonuclease